MPPPEMIIPFNQIFANRAEADWAFDLLRDTTKRLEIQGAYDPRFALTLARRGSQLSLNLNFGGWLVLGFHGPGRVDLTLLANRVAWDERFDSFPFESKEGEPEARSYHLPLEMIRPMNSDLQAAWEATLEFIAQKFQNWKRTIHWKQNNPEIVEALFKPEQRERIFAGLFTEPELRYERHLTAFYQDVSEEREEYEVEPSPDYPIGRVEGEANRREGKEAIIKETREVNHVATQTNYFTAQSFDLLAQLHANPTKDFYMAHKEEFKTWVEDPFQQLFHQVAAQLPSAITDLMETKKRVFAKILKNDYGQGGAWEFYWGAFYPKGGKRIEGAQLFLGIHSNLLEFGFSMGEYGSNQRKHFIHNCQENYELLLHLLQNALTDQRVIFGGRKNIIVESDGSIVSKLNLPWQEWLQNPDQSDFNVSIVLPKQKVLQLSAEELTDQIVRVYSKLFPLVLLTTSDNPIPVITQYLESAPKEAIVETSPPSSLIPPPSSLPYPLSQLSQDTGLDEADLVRWIRAIERKKQIVLYGPPGTGKTFVAEKLAQHLTAGSDGFWELVQFHPSYAYEDFIQGLRPESQGDHVSYPMKPGRFLEFCRKAARHTGPCVLIIDEINRANLSRVFGELMYLLEYRDRPIHLAGSSDEFHIPANVRLIGTMNTADRSIALVDHALRRRFAFIALYPHYDLLRRFHEREQTGFAVEKLIALLQKLNRAIGDPHYEVGVTFFLRSHLADELEDIWRMEIEPYLEEYFFDRPEAVADFRWEKIKQSFSGD